MAFINVTINTNESVNQTNDRLIRADNNNIEGLIQLRNFIDRMIVGGISGSMQVTVRDTDPAVPTHGTGSKQSTHKVH